VRVALSPQYIVALEDYGDVVCAVTSVRVYCARRNGVRMESHHGASALVMDYPVAYPPSGQWP